MVIPLQVYIIVWENLSHIYCCFFRQALLVVVVLCINFIIFMSQCSTSAKYSQFDSIQTVWPLISSTIFWPVALCPIHFVANSPYPIHYVPLKSVHTSSLYDHVARDLPRSNNSIEGWHRAFNCRVSIKYPTVTKLAKCILREQTKFQMNIERIRVGQEPRSKKKINLINKL